jgi:hypothetical protein
MINSNEYHDHIRQGIAGLSGAKTRELIAPAVAVQAGFAPICSTRALDSVKAKTSHPPEEG